MEVEKVIKHLYESLSFKLDIGPQNSLSKEFLSGVARKLHMKNKNPTIRDILGVVSKFGLELDHIIVKDVESGDPYQVYFFLDILNVLLDSIFQVKQKRLEASLKKKSNNDTNFNSSGGEEITKILDCARKTFGRVHSIRGDVNKENINFEANIKPQKLPAPFPSPDKDSIFSGSSSVDSIDNVQKPQPPRFRTKSKRQKGMTSKKESSSTKTAINESEHEINVKIPTSDTTEVMVKVKPLDNTNLKNKRIHVRINKSGTPDRLPSSNKIVYGRKSLIGHHLRKTRPPMFSQKIATPRLDKKQLLKRVVEFAEEAKREEMLENVHVSKSTSNKELEAKLKCQKLIRDKRTNAAQLRKLVKRIH